MSTIKVKWRGEQAAQLARAAAYQGLVAGGEHLLSESKAEVPIDQRILQNSGAVTPLPPDSVAVSYNTPYAVKQHEELSYNHPKGGKAKYLEDPYHREKNTIRKLIATTIRRALG